jgi:hypothetical protein
MESKQELSVYLHQNSCNTVFPRDMVCLRNISVNILHKGDVEDNNNNNNKWYTHVPKPVDEEGDVTVLWNLAVHTEREITENRSDIIIKNKKE